MTLRRPSRPGRRQLNIKTLVHLSRRLNVRLEVLEGVAESIVFQYVEIRIPKKDGKSRRTINAPGERLKRIQRSIQDNLLADLWLPDSIHGSRTGRSVVTATAPHRGRPFWWRGDIKDFWVFRESGGDFMGVQQRSAARAVGKGPKSLWKAWTSRSRCPHFPQALRRSLEGVGTRRIWTRFDSSSARAERFQRIRAATRFPEEPHFYPSISAQRVYDMFIELGCAPDVARLLTRLTTYDHRLPQGTPTSSTLANLFLRFSGVAERLEGLARTHGWHVTLYGDDILITSENPFMRLQGHIRDIIESCALRLHPTKTQKKVVGPDAKHEALGVITNGGGHEVDVLRSYRRRLRSLLRLCRKYGPGILVRRGIAQDPRAFLRGKVAYAIQVNPRHQGLLDELAKLDWDSPHEAQVSSVRS